MKCDVKFRVKALCLAVLAMMLVGTKAWAADDVKLEVTAPSTVEMGAQFEIAYTVNSAEATGFRAPSFDNLDVKFGPTTSRQSYRTSVNGQVTQVSNVTYTYIVMPVKVGQVSLPAASITVKGKTYKSAPVNIKVIPEDKNARSSQSNSGVKRNNKVSGDDLFVVAQLSKTEAYEQEAILLTYKLYASAVNILTVTPNKSPDFKGFHAQNISNLNNTRWELDRYKGRNYRTAVLQQELIFPQQSGKLTINPSVYEVVIEQPVEFEDPFDAFFNSSRSSSFRQMVSSQPITVNVKPLPSKPLGYNGAVGNFTMTTDVSSLEVKANEAVTIKLIISGTGNMKLMSNPVVEFPSDFELYDPKIEDNVRISENGDTGNRVIEYLVIPRHEGNFKIDPIKFNYFDLKTKSYKTLSSQTINLKVAKSANGSGTGNAGGSVVVNNFTNKEDLKILNEDIRFIKQNEVTLRTEPNFIQGTWGYRLFFILTLVALGIFIIFNLKQAQINNNVALSRNKKANKMARNRMKAAYKLMTANNKNEFYDEVLRALWGYISDKLTIPMSKLTKDTIDQELVAYNVDESLRKDFIDLLNDCEFAKFAPGDDSLAMDKILERSTTLIGNLDGVIKNKKN